MALDKGAIDFISEQQKIEPISEQEIEIANKIISALKGQYVSRAKSILEFCIQATEYTKVN